MSTSTVLTGISVLFASILAGGVVTVSLVMIPALRACAPLDEFQVHRTFNPLPDYYMPQSLFVSMFAAIGILAIDDGLSESVRTLNWIAIALSLPVVLISLALNRRINLVIRRWTADGLPSGYAQLRADWDIAHVLRTVLCVIIAVCYIATAASGPTGVGALRVVNGVMAAMMAGGLVMVMVAVVPTFRRLPDRLAVRLHREVDRYVDVPLPIFTALTFVTALLLAVVDTQTATTRALTLVAAAGALLVALSSHFVNRPMNLRLRTWGDGPVAPEYPTLRRRWDLAHAARTVAGLTTLVCTIVAMLAH